MVGVNPKEFEQFIVLTVPLVGGLHAADRKLDIKGSISCSGTFRSQWCIEMNLVLL